MRKTFAGRWLAALLTLALICSLAPASFADDPTPTVSLDRTSLTIAAGETEELTAAISDAADTNAKITDWKSNAESVATVTADTTDANKAVVTVSADAAAGSKAIITATYTVTDTGGSETKYSDTCEITVGSLDGDPKVASLAVKLYTDANCTEELAGGLTMKVKEYRTIYAKVEPTWSDGTTGTGDHTLLRTKLTWAVTGGGNFVNVSTGTAQVGVCAIVLNAQSIGGAEINVTATYDNPNNGKQVSSDPVECDVTVGDIDEVVITEYGAKTREVHLTLGDTTNPYKDLRAYLAKNNQWMETKAEDIKWSFIDEQDREIATSGIARMEVSKVAASVRITPKAKGSVRLRASYKNNPDCYSEVVCVVEEKTGTDPSDPDNPTPPSTDDELPSGVSVQLSITTPAADPYTMDPGSVGAEVSATFTSGGTELPGKVQVSRGGGAIVEYTAGGTTYELPLTWTSSNKDVAQVGVGGKQFRITADQPGETTLTVTLSDKNGAKASDTLIVIVKGFTLKPPGRFELYENGSMELKEAVEPYGGAEVNELTCWSDDSTIAAYVNGKIEAYKPGTTQFTVSDPNRGFRASFDVTVKADPNATINYGTLHAQTQKFLSFSDLLSSFRRQAGGSLSHITGINMASGGGDLYYKYNATTGAGTGVGAENYYHPYRAGGIPYGGRSLEDLTFVPKKGYAGQVTIYYTGVSEGGKNYVCQLLITVDPESGSDAGISLATPYNTALRLSGDDFNRVCRERLGVKLDHVVFSQPPERQGTLYTDYAGPGNYGQVVSPNTRYSLKQIDNIWFVPAPGFSGTVTLYYTAYGTGTNAGSFAGQAAIAVRPEDGVAIGGLTFDTVRGSAVRFDDERFNSYCRQVLQEENWYGRQTLSRVRFDALPSAGEGALYYDYRSSSNPGTPVETGTSYYYGARDPRIDRLIFIPAADFVGTVRIPFTGWTSDGTSFTGNVEVNVRGGGGRGDILYVCAPGRSVSFRSGDFANLSRDLTGRTINYIIFRDLPASSAGSLYYNNSRITSTGTRYQNSSIGRLSFRASDSFSGAVDIPFEGRSASGESFSGVVTISTSSSGGSGGSGGGTSRPTIRYTSSGGGAAVFDRYDFDSLSQWETGRDVTSVRFQAPSSAWGDLFRNYRSSSNPGTRIASSASVTRSGLDQVAFVPAGSYTGTVYIDFTATSGNGDTFSGTVEVAVERSTWNIPTPAPTQFYDVASSAYYAEPVRWAVENGITSGTSSTTFSPHQTCTVAQILSFLYRASGSPQVSGSNPFTDVRTSDYYYEAALWAHQRGMVSGSTLRPSAPCTRASTMEYMWKAAGSPAVSYDGRFRDVSGSASYARAVAWATNQRITSGTSSTTFSPDSICTRGQIVSFLYRAMSW